MGRSQVKYNKTHGRPGSKGRGGGGRGRGSSATSSRQQNQHLESDNAWRYETEARASSTTADEMDLEMFNLETQKYPYCPEAIEDIEASGQQLGNGISVQQMGKALDQLSVSDRLGIPAYMTVDLEVRDVHSRVMSLQCGKTIKPPVTVTAKGNGELSTKGEKDSADDGEDDLDAWLDSVIT